LGIESFLGHKSLADRALLEVVLALVDGEL
jgi:hypothetical protein